ncbi:NifB/NifX family molybdenum-iron cluster-binding protein [Candidatus Parcubacteria bacterium]|nr:NifB/NifX family molybdenum-iron cluster-binding protein [Candidatus Parcubacteria bacterium]
MTKKISEKTKICITAEGRDLNAFLDPRFGRAVYFLFVDSKGKLIKAIKNHGVEAMRGAGVTAAQIVADEKVKAVITGNIGPNAIMVLSASGIKVFIGKPGAKVKDVLKEYQEGKLQEIAETLPYRRGPGRGPGSGRGFGRGRI